jgi:hypothetical protein
MRHLIIALLTLAYGTMVGCSGDFDGFVSGQSSNKNDDSKVVFNAGEPNETDKNPNAFGAGDTSGGEEVDYTIFSGDGSGCKVIKEGAITSPESEQVGSIYRTTFYHETAVVDPGNTGNDPSRSSFPAVSPEDSSRLNVTELKLSADSVGFMSFKNMDEIEYMIFAHQFGFGHDRIKIEFITGDNNYSDLSSTNPYSAYGYLNLKNLRVEGRKVFADLEIYSFNYEPGSSSPPHTTIRNSPPGQSPRDGTEIIGPASVSVTPKVSEKNVEITNATVRITIDAASYDSFQYRAIRGTIWSQEQLDCN